MGLLQLQENTSFQYAKVCTLGSQPQIQPPHTAVTGSTQMSGFYQDRRAEPCPSSTCHYHTYTVVTIILINLASRNKRKSWVGDSSMSPCLTSTTVHPWKGKGTLPPLLQHYSCETSCANKWCCRFPVMSLTEGSWLPLQEENKSLILILMPALSGKGAGRQTQLPSKTWKFRCLDPGLFHFFVLLFLISHWYLCWECLCRLRTQQAEKVTVLGWGWVGNISYCMVLAGNSNHDVTWQEL